MNSVEVAIVVEQSVCVVQPAESQETSVILPASQEIAVPIAASQELAVVIPVEQAVHLVCESSDSVAPVYSGYSVQDGSGAGTVTVGWISDIGVTSMARHRKVGDLGWVYTAEDTDYDTAHNRKLNATFEEGDYVEWQGGGEIESGGWYWADLKRFTIINDEPIPEG